MGNLGPGSIAATLEAMFLYFLATLVGSTAISAVLAKLFARQVPFLRLVISCFKAFAPVLLLALVIGIAGVLTGMRMSSALTTPLTFAGQCAVGWLITRDLKSQGVPANFPGVGAKVMTCFIVLTLVVVVVVIVALGA